MVILSIFATLLVASGMRFVTITGDYTVFFGENNPQLKEFVKLTETYTKIDNIVIAIAPRSGEVFSTDALEAVKVVTDQSWRLPYALRVDSITNFQYTYADGDELIVQDLVENPAGLTKVELEEKKNIALAEPFLKDQLINENATVTGVNVTFQFPGKNLEEIPTTVAAARKMVDELQSRFDVDVHLTGVVMLSDALSSSSLKDMSTLVPLMYLVILVVTGLLLRSISAIFSTFVIIILSILAGMGFAGFLGIKLTAISAAAPTIIMPLAVADAIHILISMYSEMRKGVEKRAALAYSLRVNMWPIFLTSATTAIGFLTLNFSDAPPFHDLGNIVAFAVMAAFFLSVTLFPALVLLLPVRVPKQNDSFSGLMNQLGLLLISNQRGVLIGSLVIGVLLLSFIPRNELNDNFMSYYDESMQFKRDTTFVDENLTGIYQIQYSLDSGKPNGVSDPEFLRIMDDFASYMRKQPEVRHVSTISDTFKRLNKNLHGDDPAFYRLPDDPQLAAQYLLLYELSLPYGLDLNNQLNVGKSSSQIIVAVNDMPSLQLQAIAEKGSDWLKDNAGMTSYGVGPAIMFAHIAQRNIYSMLEGTLVAILIISLIIMATLRSIKLALVCLIPNLLPAALAAGVWGMFFREVNVGVAMVACVVLGIVVDGTVHFLSKYKAAKNDNGFNTEQAVQYSLSSVGVAILITSIILAIGFSILSLSSFGMNSNMGLLTMISIVMAVLADLILLPVLLLRTDKGSELSKNQIESSAYNNLEGGIDETASV